MPPSASFTQTHSAPAFRWSAIYQRSQDSTRLKTENLRHIEHFVVYPSCLGVVVPVDIKFEAGRWNAYVEVSEQLWSCVRSHVDRLTRVAAPRGRQRLVNFEREMHVNTSCDHRKGCFCGRISDPKLGHGLTARYIWIAHTITRILILEGRHGWTPVR
jgi:hypothetical protein